MDDRISLTTRQLGITSLENDYKIKDNPGYVPTFLAWYLLL